MGEAKSMIDEFKIQSERDFEANKSFLRQLKRKKNKNLDDDFQQAHDTVFADFDCLTCANCCKTTSPIFYNPDIERLARSLKMKITDFIAFYLKMDDDGDYVLQSSPCPFLGNDNLCIVYENRPKACREYPHTNRKRIHQILKLTLKNTKVCPATLKIVNQLRQQFLGK